MQNRLAHLWIFPEDATSAYLILPAVNSMANEKEIGASAIRRVRHLLFFGKAPGQTRMLYPVCRRRGQKNGFDRFRKQKRLSNIRSMIVCGKQSGVRVFLKRVMFKWRMLRALRRLENRCPADTGCFLFVERECVGSEMKIPPSVRTAGAASVSCAIT